MIVVSVFMALAADAWWDNRNEARRSADQIDRLAAEVEFNVHLADTVLAHTVRVEAATDTIRTLFESSRGDQDGNTLVINAYNATRRWGGMFTTSALDEMISSGNLGLIKDASLRAAL